MTFCLCKKKTCLVLSKPWQKHGLRILTAGWGYGCGHAIAAVKGFPNSIPLLVSDGCLRKFSSRVSWYQLSSSWSIRAKKSGTCLCDWHWTTNTISLTFSNEKPWCNDATFLYTAINISHFRGPAAHPTVTAKRFIEVPVRTNKSPLNLKIRCILLFWIKLGTCLCPYLSFLPIQQKVWRREKVSVSQFQLFVCFVCCTKCSCFNRNPDPTHVVFCRGTQFHDGVIDNVIGSRANLKVLPWFSSVQAQKSLNHRNFS